MDWIEIRYDGKALFFEAARYWGRVTKLEGLDACWNWNMVATQSTFTVRTGPSADASAVYLRPTQIAWAMEHGEAPPKGELLDRACSNLCCVRPGHIVSVPRYKRTEKAIKNQRRDRRTTETPEKIERAKKDFMKCVEVLPNGCWFWLLAKSSATGYGRFTLNGKGQDAHRVSYQLFHGPITPGFEIRHGRCSDRSCVAPAHLSEGTHQQNMQDMIDYGRVASGERNSRARLTAVEVGAMRAEYVVGRQYEDTRLANKYRTTIQNVQAIIHDETWREVRVELGSMPAIDEIYISKHLRGEANNQSKGTDEQVKALRLLYGKVPMTELLKMFPWKRWQIWAIATGRERKEVKDDKAP